MPKTKKRKNYFAVELEIQKLLNVPYVQGHFFTKVKLLKQGDTCGMTIRQPVSQHEVKWNQKVAFDAKLYTDVTGVLIPSFIQVSARKESEGGKSISKLGVVNIDLASFAGKGRVERRYLLQAKTKTQGKDNSILKLAITMRQTSGDPLFQVSAPKARTENYFDDAVNGDATTDSPLGASAGQPRVGRVVELAALDESLVKMQDVSYIPTDGMSLAPAQHREWMSTRVPADAIIDKLFSKFPPKIAAIEPVAYTPSRDEGSPESGALADMFLTSTPDHGRSAPSTGLDQLPSPLAALGL